MANLIVVNKAPNDLVLSSPIGTVLYRATVTIPVTVSQVEKISTELADLATKGLITYTVAMDSTPAVLVPAKIKYVADIGNGALTTIAITHGLGTKDVHVEVYVNATGTNVPAASITSITRTDANTVTIVFTAAPATNANRVVIIA